MSKVLSALGGALPDERPLLSLQIVESVAKCPAGYFAVSKTYDEDADAALLRQNGLFGKKPSHYICLSKSEGVPGYVMDGLAVVGEREAAPSGFSVAGRAGKRRLCTRVSRPSAAPRPPVTDVIVCSRLRSAPQGFVLAGEINGKVVCYKVGGGSAETSPTHKQAEYENIVSNTPDANRRSQLITAAPAPTSTASPRAVSILHGFVWACAHCINSLRHRIASLARVHARTASGPLGDSPLLAAILTTTTFVDHARSTRCQRGIPRGPLVDNEWTPKVEAALVGCWVALALSNPAELRAVPERPPKLSPLISELNSVSLTSAYPNIEEFNTSHDYEALSPSYNINKPARPAPRSARIATTILLANPGVRQQCLHCCVSAWRASVAELAVPGGPASPPPPVRRKGPAPLPRLANYQTLGGHSGLEGVPFLLNPRLRGLPSDSLMKFPIIKKRTSFDLDRDYSYSFAVERQT
ncbi:hypothetical protein MSG28_000026 [Choristoneura fumiferana]|uniref:Uncharacterized protein n=1 Tax=Choristoneura fumiferana TaxID=7141 RepID=A0ACC0JYY8_CHOFU|nr:hypothetical protein MSG28_000026 [Choristoneura fumiferana]